MKSPNLDQHRGFRAVVIFVVRCLLHLLFRVEYRGVENLPERGPLLLAANHQSLLDVVVILMKPKFWIYWLGKKELMENSAFARAFFRWWQMIPVDREKLDIHSMKAMMSHLKEGKVVGVFPEGTRLPEGARFEDYPPKSGTIHYAARHGIPILPVSIEGRFKFRSKIIVHYGKPYSVELPRGQVKTEIRRLGYELMAKIYAPMGRSYPVYQPQLEKETGEDAR